MSSAQRNSAQAQPLPVGSTLGVFGGGQLGRMFAQAAEQMDYKVHVYCPEVDCPAGQIAAWHTQADYHDFQAIAEFAQQVAGVTLEFENVPVAAAEAVAYYVPVCPNGEVLYTVQDRSREKGFLTGAGVPCAAYRYVRTAEELHRGIADVGCPAVLKTTKFGYDGKGQIVIQRADESEEAWARLGKHKCVLEQFVPFAREISVLVARGADGAIETFGPMENTHANHILDLSVYPAATDAVVAQQAIVAARRVATELDLVGIACVEFFETVEGEVLVNEIAPRPHNSGHLTIEASTTSQFEQQVLALVGRPLGKMEAPRPAAMANLLGDLWANGEPAWDRVADYPGVVLHLYGKHAARPGRKMGHLTALADSPEEAAKWVLAARRAVVQ